jgi:7-cyano-7-deazaguanine reductase
MSKVPIRFIIFRSFVMASQPSRELEVFPNPQTERDYTIRIRIPEFTCLCPKTGQPDFATLVLEYIPDRQCVELKSLKMYVWSFRNEGAFHEAVTNEILADLVAATEPRFMRLKLLSTRPKAGSHGHRSICPDLSNQSSLLIFVTPAQISHPGLDPGPICPFSFWITKEIKWIPDRVRNDGGLEFITGDRINCQCMNIGLHHVTQGIINCPVARQDPHAVEFCTDDRNAEMPQAAFCAFMTGMHMTVIIYIQ